MQLLLKAFSHVVDFQPESLALIESDRSITYSELYEAINKAAYWLIEKDLNKGDRVGIHLPNSIEYVIAYYACWRVGLVPVAMNTLASQREIDFWVDNSGCRLFFSDKPLLENQSPPIVKISYRDNQLLLNGQNASARLNDREESVSLDDVATIIYTSGTTGNPKGITLLHRNLSTNIQAIIKSLKIKAEERFLCLLPFFYSFGNSILHTHLVTGATLVLLNRYMFPNEILKSIEGEKCQGFAGVPSIYISLLKKTDFRDYDLSSLRYVTQAGGPLAYEFIDRFKSQLPEIEFVVMYGQTEASARISYLPPSRLHEKIGSVGIAVDDLEIMIQDETGQGCLPDTTGEICVKGGSVMVGYWRNPVATKKVLRDGWLHTGDMGYMDADGYLYIKGRQAEMLKISEHRVSPYEIEEVILQIDGIEECAVIGCTHEQMGQFAKAFVVTTDTIKPYVIKKYCKDHLAGYKIPKEIEFVSKLPKTSSGKIKRGMLAC